MAGLGRADGCTGGTGEVCLRAGVVLLCDGARGRRVAARVPLIADAQTLDARGSGGSLRLDVLDERKRCRGAGNVLPLVEANRGDVEGLSGVLGVVEDASQAGEREHSAARQSIVTGSGPRRTRASHPFKPSIASTTSTIGTVTSRRRGRAQACRTAAKVERAGPSELPSRTLTPAKAPLVRTTRYSMAGVFGVVVMRSSQRCRRGEQARR